MHSAELMEALMVMGAFVGLIILEFALGLYKNKFRLGRGWATDFLSLLQLAVVLKPAALFLSLAIASTLWPAGHGALKDLPFWAAFLIVFVPDDFMHYWYHRMAHVWNWMWPMHRTHHTAQQYSVTIAFRENWSWLFFLPGFWWMGLMIHLGLGHAVIVSASVIGLHNVLLHYGLEWDRKLYRMPVIRNIMRFFEYFINTPSLHRGHHGLGKNSVPFGNYAQTLSIWDHIFGTAVFMGDKIPEKYGTIAINDSKWYQQLWWPLFRWPKIEYTDESLEYLEEHEKAQKKSH